MKARFVLLIAFALAACGQLAPDKKKIDDKPAVRLTLLPQGALVPGQPVTVLAKLNNIKERVVLTPDNLDTARTEKFHLLVIDPTLTDYQHLHPQPTAMPGVWSFSFTPKLAGGYRAWADIIPAATHKQEFPYADLGAPRGGGIHKIETHEAAAGGYHFALSFDRPPQVDEESAGSLTVTGEDGKPAALQPVMGASAHIVGFYDDFRTVLHAHAMTGDHHPLMFRLAPRKAGFVKLFAQVRIGGRDIFAPFGIKILPLP